MTLRQLQCGSCKHFLSGVRVSNPEKGRMPGTCQAFPGGIPSVLFFNEIPHNRPYAGDGGIMFEQAQQEIKFDMNAITGDQIETWKNHET